MNAILEKPCCFCGYRGENFFEKGTHHPLCPFYSIKGEMQREAKMHTILQGMFTIFTADFERKVAAYTKANEKVKKK